MVGETKVSSTHIICEWFNDFECVCVCILSFFSYIFWSYSLLQGKVRHDKSYDNSDKCLLSSEPIKKKLGTFLTSMSYHKVKCAESDKKWGFLLVRRKSISKSWHHPLVRGYLFKRSFDECRTSMSSVLSRKRHTHTHIHQECQTSNKLYLR